MELIVALLFTGCIGAGLAWIGRGYWINARTTRDGVVATASIDRLRYSGPYVVGQFFAVVSFRDAAGVSRTAEIALPAAQWNRLREGQSLRVLYSAADPECVTLGGLRMRVLSEAAGAIFVVLGVLSALTAAWILVSVTIARREPTPNGGTQHRTPSTRATAPHSERGHYRASTAV